MLNCTGTGKTPRSPDLKKQQQVEVRNCTEISAVAHCRGDRVYGLNLRELAA